ASAAFLPASAGAEGTASPPLTRVSVQGVGTAPIAQGADKLVATAAYREAMAAAVVDGRGKAEYLLSKAGGSLAPVLEVVEEGGWITCTGGAQAGYVEYEGEQPDFGDAQPAGAPLRASSSAPAASVGAPRPGRHSTAPPGKRHAAGHKKKKKGKRKAKKAAAVSCTITALVSLSYSIA
ncbi:MAG: hypothetical protein KGJ43_08220, partial [Acidobacteriota bacterium]|nr:hypothetical protein [Acidobacteriota bacterium]